MRRIVGLFLGTVAIFVLITDAAVAVRQAAISSFLNPHSLLAGRYFHSEHYLYGGGVTPRALGTSFTDAKGGMINPTEIALDFNTTRPSNGKITLNWRGDSYVLPLQDEMICPVFQFVSRDSYILFTIPVVKQSDEYFTKNNLRKVNGGYVADEFKDPQMISLFENIDLFTVTDDLDPLLEHQIKNDINQRPGGGTPAAEQEGTYVNADFHVRYDARLLKHASQNAVDIAGLPLRYYWDIGSDGKAIVTSVQIFRFPTNEQSLQYAAVILFQTIATLRQIRTANPSRFSEVMSRSCLR